MKILIHTSANAEIVPFDHQQMLVGTIHKWLGHNDLHGKISLYSFSWLKGAKRAPNNAGLLFPHGADFYIGFYEPQPIKQIIQSILMNDAHMFCGLRVQTIDLIDTPDMVNRELFYCASPIFIHRNVDGIPNGKYKHYTYKDVEANQLLKESLMTKMSEAGLPEDDTLDIRFDLTDPNRKTKKINYRNIGNMTNLCRVIIQGKPETKEFAWLVGLGNSTGSGYGAIE